MTHDPLLALVRAEVERQGFELVEFRRSGTAGRPVLTVRADRPESQPGAGITTAECASLSRALERLLEDGRHVGAQYVLEVSSPGIERPLGFVSQWRRAVGQRAKVRVAGLKGRPEVEVLGVPDDDTVELRLPDGTVQRVLIGDVREAHLVVDWKTLGRKKPA